MDEASLLDPCIAHHILQPHCIFRSVRPMADLCLSMFLYYLYVWFHSCLSHALILTFMMKAVELLAF
jgi:hypothetical protein